MKDNPKISLILDSGRSDLKPGKNKEGSVRMHETDLLQI